MEAFWKKGKGNMVHHIFKSFLYHNPASKSFRYYDPIFAQKLYKHYKTTIEKANRLLVDEEKLPLQPHQLKGYTTTWNKNNIDPEDIQIVIDAFNAKEFFENSSFKKFCPKDFNMSVYFSKNLDLFVEEKNPYEHYYENHVKVNR